MSEKNSTHLRDLLSYAGELKGRVFSLRPTQQTVKQASKQYGYTRLLWPLFLEKEIISATRMIWRRQISSFLRVHVLGVPSNAHERLQLCKNRVKNSS